MKEKYREKMRCYRGTHLVSVFLGAALDLPPFMTNPAKEEKRKEKLAERGRACGGEIGSVPVKV